jgi:hypothetical protein
MKIPLLVKTVLYAEGRKLTIHLASIPSPPYSLAIKRQTNSCGTLFTAKVRLKMQRLRFRIQGLSLDEQGAMVSAVASKIFLPKASRNLFEKEVI